VNRLKIFLLASVAFVVAFVANMGAASACYFGFYEPDVPKSLKK